jgi:hypothetical protein
MAGCSCSITPDDPAIRRNQMVRGAPDARLFAELTTALDRFDGLIRRPLIGFIVFSLGLRDRERQQMTGLEYVRLLAMAGEPAPAAIDTERMVWVPIEVFRRLLGQAGARRGQWEAEEGSATPAASAA